MARAAKPKSPTNREPTLGADPEISALPFEGAMEALEAITDKIESGEIGLEQSLSEYERGMKLIARCREILDRAEQRVTELTMPPGPSPRDLRP